MSHPEKHGIDPFLNNVDAGAQILRSPLPPNLEIPAHVRRFRHFSVGPSLSYKLRDDLSNDSRERGTEVKTKTHSLQGFRPDGFLATLKFGHTFAVPSTTISALVIQGKCALV